MKRLASMRRRVPACALPALLCAAAAMAATPATAQILIDEGRADRLDAEDTIPAPAVPAPQSRIVDVAAQDETGVMLREVRVEGSTAPTEQLEPIWRPFVGRSLNTATVTEVATAISTAYEESGAAIYTVVAPAQDLSQGVLTLTVIEGYVEQVVLQGDVEGRDLSLVRAYAEKLTQERPLLRPTLERYLSLIRDIPGMTMTAQFLEGEARGAARLALTLEQKRAEFTSALNMNGSPLLGRTQVSAQAELFGLLRQGDRTTLGLTLPTNLENFWFVSAAHRTPVGGEGMTAGIRASHLESDPEGLGVEGEATTAGLDVSYPLIRSYEENLTLIGAADMLDSSNAAVGRLLSSESTRTLRAGAYWSKAGERAFTSFGGTASFGLDALGAEVNPLVGEEGFTKLTLSAAHNRAFGDRVVARLAAGGQISGTDLPPSEQYALGGQQFGRAFASADLLGDDALAGSAELAVIPGFFPEKLRGSEIYVFGDWARAWVRDRAFFTGFHADIASAGAGVRALIGGRSQVGLELAHALEAPPGLDDHSWRVLLSWNIRS